MGIDFFDNIYILNLKGREDRRLLMAEEMCKYEIEKYEFFEATRDDNGIRGLLLSMKRLFEDAIEKKYEHILILEDDNFFLLHPVLFLREVLPQLPKDYLLFFLGLNLLSQPKRISQNILKVSQSYSTHAIAYSREAMKMILPLLLQEPIRPYDILIRDELQPSQRTYCTMPMLSTQRPGVSDIEKGFIDWGKLMAISYRTHTRNLQNMSQEYFYCSQGHTVNGYVVSPMDLQYDGKVCDCNKIRFVAEECSCPGNPTMEIHQKENIG